MTWQEYKYYFMKGWQQGDGCCVPCGFAACACLIIILLSSCSTQYVPVETVRIEHKYHTDTINITDTVNKEKETVIREARPEDSLMLAKMGIQLRDNERLLILLQHELEQQKSKESVHTTDSATRKEYVDVPYPVERKMSRWEQFCLDYGKVMLGTTLAATALLLFLLARWMAQLRRKE